MGYTWADFFSTQGYKNKGGGVLNRQTYTCFLPKYFNYSFWLLSLSYWQCWDSLDLKIMSRYTINIC